MTTPRMHHYVPETYQYGFLTSDHKTVAFYDMRTENSSKTKPLNIVKERDLYTMDVPPQGRRATFIENPILSGVDGTYARLLEKVLDRNISDEIRKELSVFLGYLRSRTPSYFKVIEGMSRDFLAKEIYESILRDPLRLQEALEADFDVSSLEGFTAQAGELLSIKKDGVLSIFLGVAENTAKLIFESGWEILIASSGAFITSDHPFCPIEDECVFVGQGRSETKRYFMVPLSSKLALRISGSHQGVSFTNLSKDGVAEINEAVAYCADRWLLGESEENLKAAHQRAVKLRNSEYKMAQAIKVTEVMTGRPQPRDEFEE